MVLVSVGSSLTESSSNLPIRSYCDQARQLHIGRRRCLRKARRVDIDQIDIPENDRAASRVSVRRRVRSTSPAAVASSVSDDDWPDAILGAGDCDGDVLGDACRPGRRRYRDRVGLGDGLTDGQLTAARSSLSSVKVQPTVPRLSVSVIVLDDRCLASGCRAGRVSGSKPGSIAVERRRR